MSCNDKRVYEPNPTCSGSWVGKKNDTLFFDIPKVAEADTTDARPGSACINATRYGTHTHRGTVLSYPDKKKKTVDTVNYKKLMDNNSKMKELWYRRLFNTLSTSLTSTYSNKEIRCTSA